LVVLLRFKLDESAGFTLLFRLDLLGTDGSVNCNAGFAVGFNLAPRSSVAALAIGASKAGSARRSSLSVLFPSESLAAIQPCAFTGVEVGRPPIAEAVVLRDLWRTSGAVGNSDEIVAVTPAGWFP
jgi:hypothetical protein